MAEMGRKKIYCDVCNTFISSEPLLVIHNNGKKHQRLLKAYEDRKASTERSIYVRGFENKVTLDNDLNEYFSQFGKVSGIFIDKEKAKYAIIEFECPTVPQAILASKHLPLFFGKQLIIKKRTLKEPTQQRPKQSSEARKDKVRKEKTGSFFEEDVLERIKYSPTLSEQVLAVVLSTCLNDDDVKLRSLIVQYLQEIFVEIFPACVVTTFGSTATGLGLKGADLDLCLLVDPEALNLVLYQNDSLPSSSGLTEQLLQFIVNVLRKFAAGFQNVVSVSTAKCPVVKFIHRDSGLSCDLSVNNRLAIRNTELIKSYVSLDDRIRPLAITLKNWGAAKRLTGGGGRQISNYCLVLMLIHYLQRTRPPVISVLQLSRESEGMLVGDAPNAEKMVINGWDCSFSSTGALCQNNDSLGTLLKEWFHYYGTAFDYVNEVVTIQHDISQRVLKASIEESVPQVSAIPSFKPSVLCVQDPFELSHNLTQNVSEETLKSFIQSCQEAYTVLSSNSEQTKDGCGIKTSAFIELFSVPVDVNQRAKKSVFSFTIPYVSNTTFPHTRLEQTCKFITDLLNSKLQIICDFKPNKAADGSTLNQDLSDKLESLPTDNEIVDNSMCVDEEDFSLVTSHKRPHEEESSSDLGVKRMKSDYESGNTTFSFLCKSLQITWQNRRRQRRLQTTAEDMMNSAKDCQDVEMEKTGSPGDKTTHCREQNPELFLRGVPDKSQNIASRMELSSPTLDTNAGVPVMEFELTISDGKGSNSSPHQQCNVVLTHLRGSLQHFANFYAFFKKYVVQSLAEFV